MKTFPVSCNKDCGGGCPLLAHVEEGKVVRISNNPAGSLYMKGCRKGFRAMDMDNHPHRLLKPLIRRERKGRTFRSAEEAKDLFREASWEEALDMAASRLKEFQARYGSQAMLDFSSGGSCRGVFHNSSKLSSRFLTLWGGATRTTGNYSSGAASFALSHVFGSAHTGMDAGNLAQSEMILLWGYNALDTRFGCEMPPRILEARKRGVPVVVIDPRNTRTAKTMGTWWIPIKPGTDTALMAAILYHLIRNDLQDHQFIEKYSIGFPELKAYVTGQTDGVARTPAWASEICGIPEKDIVKLADMYGRIKPAALLPGLSLQRALGGEEAARMTAALQLATGNTGRPGGSSGGMFWGRMSRPYCPTVPAVPHSDPSFPVYAWPDVILNQQFQGRPYHLKGAYITSSNLMSQGSDILKNIQALQKLDLIIGHDFFLTPTMAMCDIVFPAASFLERNDIVTPAGNFLLWSSRAVEPPEGIRTDYQIFTALAERLGFAEAYTGGRSAEEWLDHLLEKSEIPDPEDFKATGLFMGKDQERVGLSDFIADPAEHPLNTPSGRIEIASREYEKTGFPAYPHHREGPEIPGDYPLALVSPHPLQGIHSQFANVEGFRMEEDLAVWMHPADAAERNLHQGETISLSSPFGTMEIPLRITEDIRKGCLCLNEGLWPRFTEKNSGLTETGGSVNVLTSSEPTLPSFSSRTHTVFVNALKIIN